MDSGLGYYALDDDHRVIPATLREWSALMDDHDARRVAKDVVMVGTQAVTVSTVFLGIDHGWGKTPELFETMTFGGPYDHLLVARYPTWGAAERGHRVTVTRLSKGYRPDEG